MTEDARKMEIRWMRRVCASQLQRHVTWAVSLAFRADGSFEVDSEYPIRLYQRNDGDIEYATGGFDGLKSRVSCVPLGI